MDIQEKEWGSFAEHLKTKGVVKIGLNSLGVITNLVREGGCTLGYNDLELMWETWQSAKAQAVPEGFVLVKTADIAKLAIAVSRVDLMTYSEERPDSEKLAWQNVANKLEAMIEAQEPAND